VTLAPGPGDVIECPRAGTFRYARVLHIHPTYRDVLALDPGRYAAPAGKDTLTFSRIVMAPLSYHIRRDPSLGRVRPDLRSQRAAPFPTFKFAVRDAAGAPIYWWLWDGDAIRIAPPEEDLAALPDRRLASLDDLFAIWDGTA